MNSRLILWQSAVVLLTIIASPRPAVAQHGPTVSEARLIETLRADIPYILRLTGAPGLNLAMARRGHVVWEEGFGFADLESQTPMTAATVTHSGSMGTTYTATAVMQLVERGLLDLDVPVNRYTRGWKITNPLGGREITLRDLLTHRSGLAGNAAWSVFSNPRPLAEHVRAALARERNDVYGGAVSPTWSSLAGEKFEYSNLGVATLGYLVQETNAERLSFSDYVQRHIIDPLGMMATQYPPVQDASHVRPDIWAKMSRGYATVGPTRIPTPAIYFEDYPAGTVVTKPADHIRLLLAMQHEGRYNDHQLLKPETVRTMLTPQQDSDIPDTSIGLMWHLTHWGKPNRSFGHGGAHMYGWTNQFLAYPELDLAIAVFTNHWSLPDDEHEGARYRAAQLIIDFVRSWVERDREGTLKPVPARSWAWKVSYVQGLMLVESVNAVLGIRESISPTTIEMMIRGAAPRADRDVPRLWDADGFRAGLLDLGRADLTPAGVAAFFRSDRLQVPPEELPLIYLQLGGRGSLPAPN